MFCIITIVGSNAVAAPQGPDAPTHAQQPQSVEKGVAHYEQGRLQEAKQLLEKAKVDFPENFAVPYYLGLIYLKEGRRSDAIAEWRRYVTMDPQSANSMKIRKYITLIVRQEAKEQARKMIEQEDALSDSTVEENTLAIMPFNNLGTENIGPLGKGMAAMLISDLSRVPDWQVVDRIRLEALLQEMKLGATGLVHADTAPRVGKLLKANHVTSGSLADIEKQNLILASAVFDTIEKKPIGTQEAQGALSQFYDLEKKMACDLVKDLGKNCETLPQAFHKIHTKRLPALVAYSQGLAHFDAEDYDQAREMFQKALEEDPEFELAQEALLATPATALLAVSVSQMTADMSSSGISSSTAASASTVGGPSVAGSGSTIFGGGSAAGVGGGISTTTLAVSGAAVAAGGLALAGGSSSSGGPSPDPPAPPDPSNNPGLSGNWKGIITNSNGDTGQFSMILKQKNTNLTGTMTAADNRCMAAGDVSGDVSKTGLNLSIQSDKEVLSMKATFDPRNMTLSGRWDHSSGSTNCIGQSGSFKTQLTGAAVVKW